MSKLTDLIGLPRSGKSTVAHNWQNEINQYHNHQFNRIVVSRDNVRLALYGQRFLAAREKDVHFIYSNMVKTLLMYENNHVMMDETNCSVKSIRSILEEYDVNAEFIFINTDPEECIKRAKQTGQEDLVEVIPRMYKGLIDLSNYSTVMKYTIPFESAIKNSIEKIRQEVREKKNASIS